MNPLVLDLVPWIQQGFCCSQLLVQLMLCTMNTESPDALLAARGLCHGIGFADGPCGLLTGGAMALSLAAGASGDALVNPLLADYALWFESEVEQYGGIRCGQIALGLGSAGVSQNEINPALCGDLLALCWEKILSLLEEYQVDYTGKGMTS